MIKSLIEKIPWLRDIQGPAIGIVNMGVAYFGTTSTFIYAVMLSFTFNILAGFRADEVKFKMWRLINFEGNKFKDSLKDVLLILSITYILKGLMDLMKHNDKSVFAVQILLAVAVYYYFRNGLRNLSKAYPKNVWLRVVYYIVSFQFKELLPDVVKKAMTKAEEEHDQINK